MASTTTSTSIANRALQLVGYQPIGSLNDNDRGARAINRAYNSVLLEELRSNFWNFAIKRATLSASATAPIFGKTNYFNLPPDFLDLCGPDQKNTSNYGMIPNMPGSYPTYDDFQIENNNGTLAIVTDMAAPIYIRYISSQVTENLFDPCFAEAFSAALATDVCEELTQSNSKLANISQMYSDAIEKAKKRNSFESKPIAPPVERWITVRR